jgi:hypothetical protein
MFAYHSMATRSFESITDTHPVRSIALHPSGGIVEIFVLFPIFKKL